MVVAGNGVSYEWKIVLRLSIIIPKFCQYFSTSDRQYMVGFQTIFGAVKVLFNFMNYYTIIYNPRPLGRNKIDMLGLLHEFTNKYIWMIQGRARPLISDPWPDENWIKCAIFKVDAKAISAQKWIKIYLPKAKDE